MRMSEESDLLKKQLGFLLKSKAAAQKTLLIFEKEMKELKKGPYFESAKSAHNRVEERINDIEKMVSRVEHELAQPVAQEPKKKQKKQAKPGKASALHKKVKNAIGSALKKKKSKK